MRSYYTYILASQRNGTLYVGSAADLARRVWEHKNKAIRGFTEKYNVHKSQHAPTYRALCEVSKNGFRGQAAERSGFINYATRLKNIM